MSGQNVPYHLRLHKFVERELFFELLLLSQEGLPGRDLSRYCYASMGGRFMEDLKTANRILKIKKLYSIEKDKIVFGRQLFNKPLSWISCRLQSSEEFIDGLDELYLELDYPNFVIWLDYAVANKRGSQLTEWQTLVSKMADYDIAKITLNANIRTLMGAAGETSDIESGEMASGSAIEKAQREALKRLEDQLGSFMPSGVSAADMRNDRFPLSLAEAVRIASVKGMGGKSRSRIVPLSLVSYSDGHQMLTVTVVHLPKAAAEAFAGATKLSEKWPFHSADWKDVHKISLPDLSMKERFEIDQKLGRHPPDLIHQKLPFKLDKRRERSLEVLKSYIKHVDRYPTFGRYTT